MFISLTITVGLQIIFYFQISFKFICDLILKWKLLLLELYKFMKEFNR